MPSLADTLQANKQKLTTRDANGNLVEDTPVGVQQLAANAGLPAPPTTALGVASIGGTPKQQDMAASSQQRQAALTIAQQPQQNLHTAVREGQARTQQTDAEQAETQKSQSLKDLGQMGDRVSDFINAQRAKLEAAAPAAGVQGVNVGVASSITDASGNPVSADTASSLQPLLAQLHADPSGPNSQQLMLQVNQLLGRGVNNTLDPATINQLYQDSTSAIAAGGAGVVDDKLTVAQLTQDPKFGYTTQQLSGLLGVPEDQLANMNVAQVHDQISKVMSDEFSKSQQLGQQAQSTELGGAQRAEAGQLGREASATGIRATEDDFAKLNTSIANADQVQFGGKQMSVEDVLSDDNISKTITDYINSAPGSAARTQLEKTEPGLVDFINKNQAVLSDAASKLSAGAQTFQETQAANKKLATVGGVTLSPDLMKAILPDATGLSATKYTVDSSPILSELDDIRAHKGGDEAAAAAANVLNMAQKNDPTLGSQLSQLNSTQMQSLDLSNPHGLFAQWQKTVAANKESQAATDPSAAIATLTGDSDMTIPKMEEVVARNTAAATLGWNPGYKAPIQVGADGHIDGASVLATLKNSSPVPSLQDALNGNLQGPQKISDTMPVQDKTQYAIIDKLGGAARGGYVSYSAMRSAGLDPDEVSYLYSKSSGSPGVDSQGLKHLKDDTYAADTEKMIGPLYARTDIDDPTKLQETAKLLQGDLSHLDETAIQVAMDNTRKGILQNYLHNTNWNASTGWVNAMFPQMSTQDKTLVVSKLKAAGLSPDVLQSIASKSNPDDLMSLSQGIPYNEGVDSYVSKIAAAVGQKYNVPVATAGPAPNTSTTTFDPITRSYKTTTTKT